MNNSSYHQMSGNLANDCDDVLAALKRTSKGRLSYDRHWKEERRTQEIISQVKLNTSAITMSPKCAANGIITTSHTKCKSGAKYKVIESPTNDRSFLDQTSDTNGATSDDSAAADTSRSRTTTVCYRPTESAIDDMNLMNYEKQRQHTVSEELAKRIKCLEVEFKKCNEEFDEEYRLIRQKYALDAIKRINGFEDDYKALKDSIAYKMTASDDNQSFTTSTSKLKEIESKHQVLVEEQQRKQVDYRRKQLAIVKNDLDLMVKSVEHLYANWESVIKTDNQYFHTLKQELNIMHGSIQIVEIMSTKPDLSDLDVTNAHNIRSEVIRIRDRLVVDIERLKHNTTSGQKSTEAPISSPIVQPSDPTAINTTLSTTNSMSDSVDNKGFKDYLNLQKYFNDFENSFQAFISETKFKQKRNELQLFVKTTINTISCGSVEHVRDKLNRLSQLFSEKNVEYSGKQISCSSKDFSLNFCISLASKMFLSVCTKQKDIALTMAPILVLLWQRFPTFGKIFVAQMHDKCPYLVPYYPKPDAEDNNEDNYLIACGYTIAKDGTVESEDSFLNRMRSMIKLYSAIIQCNVQDSHPHGLMYAWIWLARTLNLEPRPAITAAILESFLSISSHKLYRFYGKQFVKLIDFIANDYIKRIESVTKKDTKRQSLVKLQMTVEDIRKKIKRNVNHKDLAPDGLIPDYFFQQSFGHSRGSGFHFNT